MLTQEQRKEIAAVGLLALALFLLLALVPVDIFGAASVDWFPSGNIIGVVGGGVQGLLYAFVGVSALFVPLFALHFQNDKGSLRRLVVDAIVGKPVRWLPPEPLD